MSLKRKFKYHLGLWKKLQLFFCYLSKKSQFYIHTAGCLLLGYHLQNYSEYKVDPSFGWDKREMCCVHQRKVC